MSLSSLAPVFHGLITLAIAVDDRLVIASDATTPAAAPGGAPEVPRVIEARPGFVVAGSGIWATAEGAIDTRRDVLAALRAGDDGQSFVRRYDRMHRARIERFLTHRFATAPAAVLRECFSPVVPPHSLLVAEATRTGPRLTIFEYLPTLTSDDTIVLTPLVQEHATEGPCTYAAIGAAAPYIAELDPKYVEQAVGGPHGPEHAAGIMLQHALQHSGPQAGPPVICSLRLSDSPGGVPGHNANPLRSRLAPGGAAPVFPPVDTRDIFSVQQFVHQRFRALYPNAQFAWLPVVFQDIDRLFGGHDADYSGVDTKYHDLEHTLQTAVCVASLLAGRHAARATPRLDPRHFELAVTAALLHDAGYLRLRSDVGGTGAKYTYCHILRSCAFAASYLPALGANVTDVEVVINAINCTGPQSEISRLRFRAPVEEIIACAVATADFLSQMAAPDYPDDLPVLFEELEEADNFLHLPPEQRMFKSAHDLIVRTPQFWHRYVLPRLETEFRGVYRFLGHVDGTERNAYVEAVEANIAEIRRRLAEWGLSAADAARPPAESRRTSPAAADTN